MANAEAGNNEIDTNALLGQYLAANEAAADQQAPMDVPPPATAQVEPLGAQMNDVEGGNVDLNGKSDSSRFSLSTRHSPRNFAIISSCSAIVFVAASFHLYNSATRPESRSIKFTLS